MHSSSRGPPRSKALRRLGIKTFDTAFFDKVWNVSTYRRAWLRRGGGEKGGGGPAAGGNSVVNILLGTAKIDIFVYHFTYNYIVHK